MDWLLKNSGRSSRFEDKMRKFSKFLWHFKRQVEHKRNYDEEEDKVRFELFKESLKEVEEQNEKYKKGESSWFAGINQFSDRKQEEKPGYKSGILVPGAPPGWDRQIKF